VTPTIAQRLWLERVELPPHEQRKLLSARAAFGVFVAQASVGLGAASVSGSVAVPTLAAAALACALGLLVLLAYERLAAAAKALVPTAGALVVAIVVLSQPHGEHYSILNVGIVFYVCFFFSARSALVQVVFVMAVGAASAAFSAPGVLEAGEAVTLTVGTFTGVAAITILLRRRLVEAITTAWHTSATLDAFFEHAAAGFAFLDRDLRHVRVNEPLAEMLGIPADELRGKTVRQIAPHLADTLEPLLRRVLESGKPLEGIELASRDGQRHYLVSYYAIDGAEDTLGLGETVVEVTRLKDVERRLEETNRSLQVLATTDELTQLPNRRMFGEQLDLALARARRGGLAVAVLCLDLDRFKDVNDTLGHAYGDELLVEIAGRLRTGARETDVVARIGGDEFVILLADLDVQDAAERAQTVVERIGGLLAEPIAIGPVELKVETSVGVAIYPLDSRDAKGLLAVADAAMYAGKSPLVRIA
jgi:diguanylate cyclase (GGDEF)-like protein/PAS domain S-box-containing protein